MPTQDCLPDSQGFTVLLQSLDVATENVLHLANVVERGGNIRMRRTFKFQQALMHVYNPKACSKFVPYRKPPS